MVNQKNNKESVLSSDINLFNKSSRNEKIAYNDFPVAIKEYIDNIASVIFDPDGGKLMVIGYPITGKSFIIEQFYNNIEEFLPKSNLEALHFLTLNKGQFTAVINNHGSLGDYINYLTEKLYCKEEELCFVVEHPDIAANLSLESNKIKILFEVNISTFSKLLKTENDGQSKVWNSWSSVDLNDLLLTKEELVESLAVNIIPKFEGHKNFDFSKKHILTFVNYVIRMIPEIKGVADYKGLIILPPGYWGQAIRRIASIMIYSNDESLFNKRGQKVFGRVVEKVYNEFANDFNDGLGHILDEDDDFLLEMEKLLPKGFIDAIGELGNIGSISLKVQDYDEDEEDENENENDSEHTSLDFANIDTLPERLKKEIIGQDDVIDAVVDGLTVPAVGLHDRDKPIRTFLFLGPTGVGKTKLATTLAKEVMVEELNLIRLDMSEYAQEHEAAKLFGAPPGYLGNDKGGVLTNSVKKNPNSLILLDEVEKAHPRIWDSFLQIFDAGRMTDGQGVVVDFTNTIIIMTSNLGTRNSLKPKLGFNNFDEDTAYANRERETRISINNAVEEFFRPELLNRIDEKIIFNELSKKTIEKILIKEISIIKERMKEKGYSLNKIDKSIIERLLELSDVSKYGAREIQRVVFKNVSYPIARRMLNKENTVKKITLVNGANNEINTN